MTKIKKPISYIELKTSMGRVCENQATFHVTYDTISNTNIVIKNAFKTVGTDQINQGLVMKSSTLTVSASPMIAVFVRLL